jgi:hypothetical protein
MRGAAVELMRNNDSESLLEATPIVQKRNCDYLVLGGALALDGDVNLGRIDKTASATSSTLTAFMHRKSIGHSRKKHGLHST